MMLTFDDTRARAEKEAALRWVERNAQEDFKDRVWSAIVTLAVSGREWCADDVRRLSGPVPAAQSPNLFGALIGKAAKQGLIEFVGFTRSSQIQGHSNRLAIWRAKA